MFRLHLKRALISTAILLALALGYYFIQPKQYEGSASIVVGREPPNQQASELQDEQLMQLLAGTSSQRSETEVQVLRGQGLFLQALSNVAQSSGKSDLLAERERLFTLYDVVTGDVDKSAAAEIRARAYDPDTAAALANEIVAVYDKIRRDGAAAAITKASDYLDRQVQSTSTELAGAEQKLEAYRSTLPTPDLGNTIQQRATYLAQLQNYVDQAKAELAAAKAESAANAASLAKAPQFLSDKTTAISPRRSSLEATVAAYEHELLDLQRQYSNNSPQVVRVVEALNGARTRLKEELKTPLILVNQGTHQDPVLTQLRTAQSLSKANLERAQKRYDSLGTQLVAQEKINAALPAQQRKLADLSRDVEVLDLKYRQIKTTQQSIRTRLESGSSAAQIITPALPNPIPVGPDLWKYALLGIVGGVSVGLLYSFVIESMRMPLHSSAQLADLTGLPVSGVIPSLPQNRPARLLRSLNGGQGKPEEAFRYMAFTVAASRGQGKRVLFTSVREWGPAVSSAAQFAVACANAGTRVVLVDADLSRRGLSESFGVSDAPGLSDLISKTMLPGTEGEVSRATKNDRLRILPAGSAGDARLSDFPSDDIEAALIAAAVDADLLVIQAPPCDRVSDAVALARTVDEVCLVLSAKAVSYRAVSAACDMLSRVGAKKISLVLTDASPQDEPFSAGAIYSAADA